ncbi:MAG: hypothetical protein NTU45_06870 [Planctomycetota bacterium]|nr:hypothetical protein [Planctomycetota bacterium]
MAKTKSKKTAKRGVKQAPKQASKQAPKQAPKQGPKQTPTNRARSAKPARATGALSLASIPIEAIAAELKRRQSEIPKLEAHARALRAELAAIEARIATLSGAAAAANPAKSPKPAKAMKVMKPANPAKPGAPRKRRDGQPTLAERILSLLGGSASPRSPREIAAALAPALGREVSQSLLVQISLTLRRLVNAGQIAQPARAQYAAAPTAKGGVADAAN